jgi:hypothetical protein
MTPDNEARILVVLSEVQSGLASVQTGQAKMQREIVELSNSINSSNEHEGLSERARESARDRLAMHAEMGDLWEGIEAVKHEARDAAENVRLIDNALSKELQAVDIKFTAQINALAAKPGEAILSGAGKILVAVLIAATLALGGLVGFQAHH